MTSRRRRSTQSDLLTRDQIDSMSSRNFLSTHENGQTEIVCDTILTKQECTVVDSTGCIHCVLWENYVNKLTIDNSYLLTNIITRSFDGHK